MELILRYIGGLLPSESYHPLLDCTMLLRDRTGLKDVSADYVSFSLFLHLYKYGEGQRTILVAREMLTNVIFLFWDASAI